MATPPPILIAKRYELKEVVGKGGYGVVYRALDRDKDEIVAVKILSADAGKDPNVVERMVREQQAMLALSGTCAASAIDLCRARSGALCLVMEWLEGEDLEQHLTKLEQTNTRLEVPRLLEILRPVVDTLGRAHELGLVHRDIKPANIFLLEDGSVRLLDFGLSRMRSAATLTAVGTVMGSPSYIAPETWKGNSKLIDHRADLYSLSVIVFRALAGRLPFVAESLIEKLKLATTAERPSLHALRPDLPPSVDEWVSQALAIDPAQRFFAARAWFNALVLVLSESPNSLLQAEPAIDAQTAEKQSTALTSAWHAASSLLKRLARRGRTIPDAPESRESVSAEAVLKWLADEPAEPASPDVRGSVDKET